MFEWVRSVEWEVMHPEKRDSGGRSAWTRMKIIKIWRHESDPPKIGLVVKFFIALFIWHILAGVILLLTG
jgi:hypothetical protein